MRTSSEKSVPRAARHGLLPAPFIFFAIALVFVIPFLAHQPKEVSAAVYSGYVSIMALVAAFVFHKKGRRGAAFAAALVCAVFVSLFAIYAHLAL